VFQPEPFGQRAVRLGFMTSDEVRQALETQSLLARKSGLVGEILVEMGFLNLQQYLEIVQDLADSDEGKTHDQMQGEFVKKALEKGYVTTQNIEDARTIQLTRPPRNKLIGQIMVEMGLLKPHERDAILATYDDDAKAH